LALPRFVDYSLRFIAPISLGLAIYYHYQSVQDRVPTYYVSPSRARIVDTSVSAPPQLQVLYKGKGLNSNVSAAVVYFWNDGKLPIKAEDVLEPLKIQLDPSCEIIDARVLRVSRGVTKFAKGDVSDTAKNVLPISFAILEHNDGGVLQIIYTGDPEGRISTSGVVIGAGQPRESVAQKEHPRTKNWRLKTFLVLLALVGVTAIATIRIMLHAYRMEARFGRRKSVVIVLAFWVGLMLPGIGIVAYEVVKSQPTVPSTIWAENQK